MPNGDKAMRLVEGRTLYNDLAERIKNVPTNAEFQALETTVGGKVADVQVDGTTVVSNGVANIPKASSSGLGVVKINNSQGVGITNTGELGIIAAGAQHIKAGKNNAYPITSGYMDYATFYGLAAAAGDITQSSSNNAVGVYTPSALSAIQHMLGTDTIVAPYESDTTSDAAYAIGELFVLNGKLHQATAAIAIGDTFTTGTNCAVVSMSNVFPHDVKVNGTSVVSNGVANIPVANSENYGVVKISAGNAGVGLDGQGRIIVSKASSAQLKGGTNYLVCISPNMQHESVFYGLSKLAGVDLANETVTTGTYPASSKAAIQSLIGVESAVSLTETVSGTTPSITCQPNVQYICGEVATISITPPANGTCDVIFESGSTAAVLTLPNTVKMPAWFDESNLETDTIYEIVITNGVYGSVMTWES